MEIEKYYNYCEELKTKYHIDELDSMTLSYRINGFISACHMDLSNSGCEKLISATRVPYINKKLDEDGTKYNINFARGYDENGQYFIVLGQYNELDLSFVNYYGKDRNKTKLNDLPFNISISKEFNDYEYSIKINTVKGTKTKFSITKSREGETLSNRIVFYANIKDFDVVFKMIKHFVINPEIVFITYNEVMNEKKVNFSIKDINILTDDDQKSEETAKKNVKRLN